MDGDQTGAESLDQASNAAIREDPSMMTSRRDHWGVQGSWNRSLLGGLIGFWGLLGILSVSFSSWAGETRVVPAIEADGLRIAPGLVDLYGPDATAQLVCERIEPGGVHRDATRSVRWTSGDETIAAVDATGLVTARGDGATEIRAELEGVGAIRVPVQVRGFAEGRPINFANDIVPIFTKLGCNGGGCHGKSGGQNGFRLGLLGFEPQIDYETLVKEGRGRRLFPAAAAQSLLVRKATAEVPHGGGRKMEPGSPEHRLLIRWIENGMPWGKESDPKVVGIVIEPQLRTLKAGWTQQLRVDAIYSDGGREDVTRRVQYQSNDTEVADVDETGLVSARNLAGQAAIMARYQGQVAVFTVQVPLDATPNYEGFTPRNRIDELALKQWRALNISPSPRCEDHEFIRRARLDITGTLPTAEEVRAFVADPDPDKRAKLVDRLLDTPEYASFFALKWADLLKNKRSGQPERQKSTFQFHAWLCDALRRNVPYDRLVGEIVAATGTPSTNPATIWTRTVRSPQVFVDDTAQVFLGMRLQCAQCHHHPFEVWSQDDYYGFASFFSRIGFKPAIDGRRAGRPNEEAVVVNRDGWATNPATGKPLPPRGLGAKEPVSVAPGDDPRIKLVEWLADPSNPFFAPALVNRYWAHFFARGLVEPIDDMRATNPASNPELLAALSNEFIASGFDLKGLIRQICTSELYGLSSLPVEGNARDRQSFARRYPRRMQAEVLLDAISMMTAAPTAFGGLPAQTRAIDLPDESVGSSFLDVFGRPSRDTACECERVDDATLGQSLMLLNSPEIQAKLAAPGGRAERLAGGGSGAEYDAAQLDQLFLEAFARFPLDEERQAALAHLAKNADRRKEAWQDILWALINAKEFQFND